MASPAPQLDFQPERRASPRADGVRGRPARIGTEDSPHEEPLRGDTEQAKALSKDEKRPDELWPLLAHAE